MEIEKRNNERNTKPTVGIDVEYYQSFLDDLDIPDAQKHELIETLWGIVVSFVELGFNVHPLNAAKSVEDTEVARSLQAVIRDFCEQEQ